MVLLLVVDLAARPAPSEQDGLAAPLGECNESCGNRPVPDGVTALGGVGLRARPVVLVLVLTLVPACGSAARVSASDPGPLAVEVTTTTRLVPRTHVTEPRAFGNCVWPATTTTAATVVTPNGEAASTVNVPYRPHCPPVPPRPPAQPPTTLLASAVEVTRANTDEHIAVRVGTYITVELAPDSLSRNGAVTSSDDGIVSVISAEAGDDGQSRTLLRAVAVGAGIVIGPTDIDHCPRGVACDPAISFSLGVTVFR